MKKNVINWKLKNKMLFSFIIVALIPVIVLGIYSYNVASNSIQEKSSIHGETISKDINERFHSLMLEAAMVTRHVIGDYELERILRKDYEMYDFPMYEKTQDIKQYQYYFNHLMNIYTSIDHLLLKPMNQPLTIGHSNRQNTFFTNQNQNHEQKWYQDTIDADGYWVYTDLHLEESMESSPEVISISRLIKDSANQQPLAIMKIMLESKTFQDVLDEKEAESDFTFVAFDEKGQAIAKSDGFPLDDAQRVKDTSEEITYDDSTYLVMNHLSTDTSWEVYALADQSLLLNELQPIKRGLTYILILTVVVAAAVAYILSSGLVRPIQHLKDSMNKVAYGKWKHLKVHEGPDEIGELAKHYNEMLMTLEDHVNLIVEKERQKKDLEFKSLKSQINPHFLYNTLNTIKWCIYLEDRELADEMISSLIYVFKFISKRKDDMIPIKEEKEFLQQYLRIMEIRYDHEFEVNWNFDAGIDGYEIPVMILQPLVENAIVHGLEKESGPKKIWLNGQLNENGIHIVVEDNGIGQPLKDQHNKGLKFSSVGLKNVKNRLQLIYHQDFDYQVDSKRDVGTRVEISFPAIEKENCYEGDHDHESIIS
ncbi:cache domain-containing sensor histidine kinase [Texcoconibacillus texcoconensis]|uniref:Two-component system sensor histidine kinase YesM n=1 Tax=Texcoconibacillus texcoconensis TaxID=1095777 RepID=A0A840QRB4_9BACI|nr:sensor histidine kinase [Texcoconibacillus texcoconensis]MBB5173890.1 two-component system sensor histidine kinase YesM [Texcoconibacillus texcoconensis]